MSTFLIKYEWNDVTGCGDIVSCSKRYTYAKRWTNTSSIWLAFHTTGCLDAVNMVNKSVKSITDQESIVCYHKEFCHSPPPPPPPIFLGRVFMFLEIKVLSCAFILCSQNKILNYVIKGVWQESHKSAVLLNYRNWVYQRNLSFWIGWGGYSKWPGPHPTPYDLCPHHTCYGKYDKG